MNALQKVILSIYKTVAELCDKNNIDYYAIGGTCIGAVRHQGFIPWDDDLDIAIPIEQFDKFKHIMKTQLPENLYLYSCEDVKEYRQLFCKVCDKNTTFIEETEKDYSNAYKGVYIDIMPMSGVPESDKQQNLFIRKLSLYYSLNYINRYPFHEMSTIKTKVIWLLLHMLRISMLFNRYSEKSYNLMKKYPFSDAQLTGYVWSYRLRSLIFPKELFSVCVEMPFEDTTMRCPSGYDKYLTQQFGDYMKLPPEEQRIQHHPFVVDLEHGYKEYIEKREENRK